MFRISFGMCIEKRNARVCVCAPVCVCDCNPTFTSSCMSMWTRGQPNTAQWFKQTLFTCRYAYVALCLRICKSCLKTQKMITRFYTWKCTRLPFWQGNTRIYMFMLLLTHKFIYINITLNSYTCGIHRHIHIIYLYVYI